MAFKYVLTSLFLLLLPGRFHHDFVCSFSRCCSVRYATRAHSQVGKKRTEEERSEDARIAATFLTSLMEHNEKGEDNEGNFIVSIEFGSIEKREQEKLRHR